MQEKTRQYDDDESQDAQTGEDVHRVFVDSSYVLLNDLVALNNQVQQVDADWSILPELKNEIVACVIRIVEHDSSQRENLAQLVRWASRNGLVESATRGTDYFDQLFEELKAIFPEAGY